ncbi:acrylyl-CoA reductase (NADPH) [Aeromonas simiae]|uniref:acrylyl-CoA reductase (NADPH) n=1 Tax=Aeromonas simiae TaxID=218936 RepID=UPI0005AB1C80|nr:MDR family oxidoreductase [Aeromonas simiae]
MKCILIDKPEGHYQSHLTEVDEASLPSGNVTVQVHYSTLNYKDALAITGQGPVVRSFPMVPGIDLAGRVIESSHPAYRPDDLVLLNGWGVGEKHWGALAETCRLDGDWLIPLPSRLTARDAMAIGTAGYTAMLCVMALEKAGARPEQGPVLVTGASGGVGSFAVALLARKGFEVVASTGKLDESDYLKALGAREVIDRTELSQPGKPLARERWAAAVDTVGSHTLVNVCAAMRYGGLVAACGMAQGLDFPASVAPFILRGVHLIGVDSVMCPRDTRVRAWERLAAEVDGPLLETIAREITLAEVIETAGDIMAGRLRGRVRVKIA